MTPLIKKELDADDLCSFHPISNVSLVSKNLERLICERKNIHFRKITTLSLVQSAYRRNYSTETALTKVVSDIIIAADTGDVTVLALLDLSVVFDTVDHIYPTSASADHSPCNWEHSSMVQAPPSRQIAICIVCM